MSRWISGAKKRSKQKQKREYMETTKKLYDLDAYGTEFEAKVLTCEEVKKKDTTGMR